ncbi:uncharacterized protein LOC131236184 [Magnolia sinica]|uniref:uncharacterized protein LOC131236184 n=1 Tax=Magnolia sinica TaxID=86752 RepID=UPI002657E7F7|nr:uncharacterized protein LOC131236184 [Magnolia sinica]
MYLQYAKLEEDYGLAKSAMKVYEQAMKAVPENEKMNMYEIYIARSTEIFGVPSTREIYEVYLGGQYINNPTLSDVTFLVEGFLETIACPIHCHPKKAINFLMCFRHG